RRRSRARVRVTVYNHPRNESPFRSWWKSPTASATVRKTSCPTSAASSSRRPNLQRHQRQTRGPYSSTNRRHASWSFALTRTNKLTEVPPGSTPASVTVYPPSGEKNARQAPRLSQLSPGYIDNFDRFSY